MTGERSGRPAQAGRGAARGSPVRAGTRRARRAADVAPSRATRRSCWPTARSRASSAGRVPSRRSERRHWHCSTRVTRCCCGSRRSREPQQSGKLTVVHNPCLSGGTLEIFLEPIMPPPVVAVHGTPRSAGRSRILGGSLGYTVVAWDPSGPADVAAVVVASHGRDEVAVLEAALLAGVPYVGLVASRKRGEVVVGSLDV